MMSNELEVILKLAEIIKEQEQLIKEQQQIITVLKSRLQ